MREAIGGGWLYTIVIFFIVLFASFLALSINYSKAFKVKNEIVSIIEENEGLNATAKTKISNYLNSVGYFVYGTCNAEEHNANGEIIKEVGYEAGNNNGYKYCVATRGDNSDTMGRKYYRVKVFFRVDIPILANVFTFPVTGETKAVYFAQD